MKVRIYSVMATCLAICFLKSVEGKLFAKAKSKDLSDSDRGKSVRNMYKLAEMMDANKGSATLSSKEYLELVFNVPRNYTVFVLFHNDRHICRSCPQSLQIFDKISKSYWRGFTAFDEATSSRNLQFPVFFVSVTMYSVGSRKMLVDLDPSKPSLYVFTPSLSSKYNQFEQADEQVLSLEFGRYSAFNMLSWVQDKSGFLIPLEKDESKSTSAITLIAMAFCGVLTLINLNYFGYLNLILEALSQANYTYGISVAILWLLSGQMYNYIRNTAFMGHWEFKLASFVYPGQHYQYGTESILVMLIYALMLYAFMSLVETRERQLEEHLSNVDVHFNVLCALSAFFFGFMSLQMMCNMKT